VEGSKISEETLLWYAASAEQGSEHPLARAIVDAAKERGLKLVQPSEFRATAGGGVEALLQGERVLLGSANFLEERGVPTNAGPQGPHLNLDYWVTTSSSLSLVFVVVAGEPAGALIIMDSVKETTPEAIKTLRAEGLRLVMLTGDRRESAERIAKSLGLTEIEAEVRPEEKAAVIERLKKEGRIVAMAGDGINDAPALAAADVGIAMGTGTDIAMENAGITLVKGDLRGIMRARRLSRATVGNIKQNLAFAFLYNLLGIPIAAGVFFPVFHWLLSPMIASAAMSFSSVSVISNALRLRRAKL
jgi:Cu+-exporting ATPase